MHYLLTPWPCKWTTVPSQEAECSCRDGQFRHLSTSIFPRSNTDFEKPFSSFGGEGAYFEGRFSVVLLIWGRKKMRERRKMWVGGGKCGEGEPPNIFPPTHPPTTFSSLKRGEPQIIFPQNRLPPIFLPQMKKRCTADFKCNEQTYSLQITDSVHQMETEILCQLSVCQSVLLYIFIVKHNQNRKWNRMCNRKCNRKYTRKFNRKCNRKCTRKFNRKCNRKCNWKTRNWQLTSLP